VHKRFEFVERMDPTGPLAPGDALAAAIFLAGQGDENACRDSRRTP
jgi:hypothetical protein